MASDSVSLNPKAIMTFRPTVEEFQDFSRYIAYMESQGAHKAGLAKIVPPKEWKPRHDYNDIDDLVIPAPIQQVVTGQSGLFTQYNIQKKPMAVSEFRKMANSDKFCSPRCANFEELERKYWKNVTFNPPIYGADVNGSLYGADVKEWNISRLNTILDTVEHDSGITIEGVNTPYLYFGMWKTTFAWHTEDMDLYSINYLHFGEPKSWYCVPPEHGKRMERLAQGFFPGSAQNCEAFLRHKMTLISPSILKKYGIPFEKITQETGEFMVTFPYAYHAGFNHGFNCAESTNFATQRWIDYGKQAILCSCRKDMVKISMDVFVKKYQPERYAQWMEGRETAAIDHSRPTPEAKEFLVEGFNDITSHSDSSSQESCVEEGERKSHTQRIETKRHRVCLEVPEEVVPKEDDDEKEKQYGKRPRLSLMPPRTASPDCRRTKGPPKLVVTPTKLTLMDPFRRCLSGGGGGSEATRPPHYTKTRAPAISSPSWHRNGHHHLAAPPPAWRQDDAADDTSATQPAPRKMGVASLLFHKTLSPKEALHVHTYAMQDGGGGGGSHRPSNNNKPHTTLQLQVHSYAREHQPRHHLLQHKAHTQVSHHHALTTTTQPPPPPPPPHVQRPNNEETKADSPEEEEAVAQTQTQTQPQHPAAEQAVAQAHPAEEEGEEEEGEQTQSKEPVEARTYSDEDKDVDVVDDDDDDAELPSLSAPPAHTPPPPPQMQVKKVKKVELDTSKKNARKGSGEQSYCKSLAVNKQQKAAQLCKLSRNHPLLREVTSDEDVSVPAQSGRREREEWAKSVARLWQCLPCDPQAEKDYNTLMGQQAPYCSICLLFHTHHQSEGSSSVAVVRRSGGRQWSKPLIPEMCFNSHSGKEATESQEGQLSNPRLTDEGTSRLVSCSQCCVRVHASCYGVSGEEANLDDWLCARCEANAITKDCCLCSLRGGALHRANNDKWVHVLCAITILEARFVDITDRSPIDLSAIPLPRFRLKCSYCRKRMTREVTGCCVQCSHGRCSTAFHPTCAQAAGVLMYPDDWPFIVFITCHRHKTQAIPERDRASMELKLALGQKVICKYKNGRYYHSDITALTMQTFYEVGFDDGSYSDNLLPEDIQNRDCVRLGPPAAGDVVQVRWTDGLIYGGKFVAAHSIPMFQVEFEDGSAISVKREDIYTLEEDLPKRVKSRMSVASNMRFELFSQKDVKQSSKRQRVINSKYREDFIEPIIYRTIME